MQNAQTKRNSLATARFGLCDHIATIENSRQTLCLDGRHGHVSKTRQIIKLAGMKREGGKVVGSHKSEQKAIKETQSNRHPCSNGVLSKIAQIYFQIRRATGVR